LRSNRQASAPRFGLRFVPCACFFSCRRKPISFVRLYVSRAWQRDPAFRAWPSSTAVSRASETVSIEPAGKSRAFPRRARSPRRRQAGPQIAVDRRRATRYAGGAQAIAFNARSAVGGVFQARARIRRPLTRLFVTVSPGRRGVPSMARGCEEERLRRVTPIFLVAVECAKLALLCRTARLPLVEIVEFLSSTSRGPHGGAGAQPRCIPLGSFGRWRSPSSCSRRQVQFMRQPSALSKFFAFSEQVTAGRRRIRYRHPFTGSLRPISAISACAAGISLDFSSITSCARIT